MAEKMSDFTVRRTLQELSKHGVEPEKDGQTEEEWLEEAMHRGLKVIMDKIQADKARNGGQTIEPQNAQILDLEEFRYRSGSGLPPSA